MSRKFTQEGDSIHSKIALREAFRTELPDSIVNRPKASFPLPFQQWLDPFRDLLFDSPFARQYFSAQAIGLVSANPNKYWHMAWPMINLTLWGHASVMREPVDSERLVGSSSAC
jgi:asparagine synthase (glutamine-hydrolysing)